MRLPALALPLPTASISRSQLDVSRRLRVTYQRSSRTPRNPVRDPSSPPFSSPLPVRPSSRLPHALPPPPPYLAPSLRLHPTPPPTFAASKTVRALTNPARESSLAPRSASSAALAWHLLPLLSAPCLALSLARVPSQLVHALRRYLALFSHPPSSTFTSLVRPSSRKHFILPPLAGPVSAHVSLSPLADPFSTCPRRSPPRARRPSACSPALDPPRPPARLRLRSASRVRARDRPLVDSVPVFFFSPPPSPPVSRPLDRSARPFACILPSIPPFRSRPCPSSLSRESRRTSRTDLPGCAGSVFPPRPPPTHLPSPRRTATPSRAARHVALHIFTPSLPPRSRCDVSQSSLDRGLYYYPRSFVSTSSLPRPLFHPSPVQVPVLYPPPPLPLRVPTPPIDRTRSPCPDCRRRSAQRLSARNFESSAALRHPTTRP